MKKLLRFWCIVVLFYLLFTEHHSITHILDRHHDEANCSICLTTQTLLKSDSVAPLIVFILYLQIAVIVLPTVISATARINIFTRAPPLAV